MSITVIGGVIPSGVLNDYALYKSTHSLTHSLHHRSDVVQRAWVADMALDTLTALRQYLIYRVGQKAGPQTHDHHSVKS